MGLAAVSCGRPNLYHRQERNPRSVCVGSRKISRLPPELAPDPIKYAGRDQREDDQQDQQLALRVIRRNKRRWNVDSAEHLIVLGHRGLSLIFADQWLLFGLLRVADVQGSFRFAGVCHVLLQIPAAFHVRESHHKA